MWQSPTHFGSVLTIFQLRPEGHSRVSGKQGKWDSAVSQALIVAMLPLIFKGFVWIIHSPERNLRLTFCFAFLLFF